MIQLPSRGWWAVELSGDWSNGQWFIFRLEPILAQETAALLDVSFSKRFFSRVCLKHSTLRAAGCFSQDGTVSNVWVGSRLIASTACECAGAKLIFVACGWTPQTGTPQTATPHSGGANCENAMGWLGNDCVRDRSMRDLTRIAIR